MNQRTDIAFGKEAVFIDTSLADYQTLVAGVKPGVEVVLIKGGESGLTQMAQWAATHKGYDSIAIVDHGNEGVQTIGADRLDDAALHNAATKEKLAQIGSALKPDGDILLYGCDVAHGETGRQFIKDFAAATGADVAASTDITGKDGNWALEYTNGNVEQFAAFDFSGIPGYAHDLQITVNSVGSVTLSYDSTQRTLMATLNGVNFTYDGSTTNGNGDQIHLTFSGAFSPDGLGTAPLSGAYGGFLGGGVTGYLSPSGLGLTGAGSWISNMTVTMVDTSSNTYHAPANGLFQVTYYYLKDKFYSDLGPSASPVSISVATTAIFNTTPTYIGGTTQTLSYDTTTTAVQDLIAYLHVSDTDASQTETWTQQTAPAHGALSFTGATAGSGTANITPGGTITYTPTGGYSGSDTFTIRVSDGTATADKTFTVYYNDPPVVTAGGTTSYTEQTPVAVAAGITIGETADSEWNGGKLSVQISANAEATDKLYLPAINGGGIWLSGTSLMAGATQIGAASAAQVTGSNTWTFSFNASATSALVQDVARAILFDDATDAPGAGDRTVTFTATDAHNYAGTSTASAMQTIAVTPVNDAPVGTSGSVTATEDTVRTFVAADFGFTDPDGTTGSNHTLQSVEITTLPTSGTVKLNGNTITAGNSIAVADINSGLLTWQPAANAYGNAQSSLTFKVNDGALADVSARTLTFNVNPVADTPSITDTVTVPTVQSTAGLVVSRAAVDGAEVTHFKITGITNGTLFQNDGVSSIANNAFITFAQANAGLKFTPNNGSNTGHFDVQASLSNNDAGLGGSTATATILVNQSPTSSNDSITTLEDTTVMLTLNDFGAYADAENDTFSAVKITTLSPSGTLEYNNGSWTPVTLNQTITVADINANKLHFIPAANVNGAPQTILAFKVSDGYSFSTSAYNLGITVTPVNDAPAGTDATLSLAEDATHTFIAANFGFTDPADTVSGTANSLLALKITTVPTAGTLTLNSVAVTAGDTVAVTDINAGKLVFTPVANANANGYATMTFQVQDNGGIANSGVDLDQSPNTITLNVTPVNDAPVLVAGVPLLTTHTENENTNAGNLVSDLLAGTAGGTNAGDKTGVTDVDTVTHGAGEGIAQGIAIYSAANNATAGGGSWEFSTNGGGSWSAIGTVTSNNVLLLSATDKIRFVPDTQNGTTATLSYYAWDESAGTHGTKVDATNRGSTTAFSTAGDTATITISDVNDAPVLDLDANNSSGAAGSGYITKFLMRGNGVAIADSDITITDVDKIDNSHPDTITSATVAITAGAIDNNFGTIYETLTSGTGTTISGSLGAITVTGSGTPSVSISGSGTWAEYQNIIKSITYQDTNPNAFNGDRTVTVTVTDGGITTPAADTLASNSADTTIHAIWAPVVDTNGAAAGVTNSVTFTEGAGAATGTAVKIASADASITDEAYHLQQVVVSITNIQDAGLETLAITGGNGANWGGLGINVAGSGTGTITLTGNLAASYYQLALRSIGYVDSSQNPTVTQRIVSIIATDVNGNTGDTGYSYVNVIPVNDAPVVGGTLTATLLEGGLHTLTGGAGNNLNATDVDDAAATLKYVITTAPAHGTLFRDANSNGVADSSEIVSATAGTGVITSFTQGDVDAGLIKYRHDSSETISDSFVFKVEDGLENGVVAPTGTFNLTVTPVNGAPTLAATAGNPTFTEGGAAAVLFTGSSVSTVEAGQNITRMKLTVSGLANGASETLMVDGTQVVLTNGTSGTSTGGGLVGYSVAVAGSTATVTLTKTATAAAWQPIIDGLAYDNLSSAPATTPRVVTLTEIKDDGGTLNGGIDTTTLSLTSTVAVTAVNNAPVGLPAISGTVTQGQTITASPASISDADGLGSFSYQWKAGGTAIAGATGSSYTLTGNDVGKKMTVTVSYTDGGGTLETLTSTQTINVVDINDPPTLTATARNPATVTGVTPLFTGAAVSTIESGQTLTQLTLTVSGLADGANEKLKVDGVDITLQTAGTTVIAGGTIGGISSAVAVVGSTATVTLTHTGLSEAQTKTLIEGLAYKDVAATPATGLRVVTLTGIQDSGGVAGGGSDTSTLSLASSINVGSVAGNNTAPAITANSGFTLFEGAVHTITAAELAATDAEQPVGSLNFIVASAPANGTLFRDANANGTVDASETLTAAGFFSQLDLTSGLIKYRHNGGETNADSFTFTVSDGMLATNPASTSAITVTSINDAPTLTATSNNPTFTEGGAAATLYSAVAAGTVEAGQNLTQLKLTVSGVADTTERLTIDGSTVALTNGINGTTAANSFGYSVAVAGTTATLTLSHAAASSAQIKTMLEALAYDTTSNNPTVGNRVITITELKDNGGTANGGTDTATLHLASTVTVAAVNNTPILAGNGFTVLEGGSFTLTTTELAASDVDSTSSSFVYLVSTAPASGTLYVDVNGNARIDSGEALALNGTFIQSQLTSGKVRYQHDGSENADTFSIKVSDGNSLSPAAAVPVTRTPVNDAPTLGKLDTDVLTYLANSGVRLVDVNSDATVTDPDSANFNGGSLRVAVSLNNNAASDVLSIKNIGTGADQIGVSGNTVSYAGSAIGTFSGGTGANDLVVTFTSAAATPAAAQALVRAIQFSNSEAVPVVNSRSIGFTMSDGAGGLSQTANVHVNIPTNIQPIILNGSGFYITENTTAVTTISATDPNNRPVTFSVSGGADAAKFAINTTTGALRFATAPDYEAPTDVGADNVYNVTVRATNDQAAYNESALVVNVVNVVNEAAQAIQNDTNPPVFGYATVNGATLVMTYTDENVLDATNIPATGAFAVQVAGNAAAVNGVAVNGTAKTITLTLATAVTSGQAVTVAYTDPTGGNDVNAIQDANGNDAATLGVTSVSNVAAGTSTVVYVPVPTPTPTPGTSTTVNAPAPDSIVPVTGGGGTTTINNPAGNVTVANTGTGTATIIGAHDGTTVTTTGSGNTVVSNPDGSVNINNTGSGAVTISGVKGANTTVHVSGAGPQHVDLSGMQPGQVLTIDNTGSGPVDITNLPDGVIVNFTGSGSVSMIDNDGVPQSIENLTPAMSGHAIGDGNGDGLPDALQSNVTSLPVMRYDLLSVNGKQPETFVTLVVDSVGGKINISDSNTASLHDVVQKSVPASKPANINMPLGLLNFKADVGAPGTKETFSFYIDGSIPVDGFYKQNTAGVWVNIATAVVHEGGKTRLDFTVMDGGEFDSDGKADGTITNPGTPGLTTTPTTPSAVYLNGNSVNVFNDINVYGGSGYETVRIQAGKGIKLDQNVDCVELPGSLVDYGFTQVGNNVQIRTSTTLLTTLTAQGDEDGTVIMFKDGSSSLKLTGTTMYLGNQPLSGGVTTFAPVSLGSSLNAAVASGNSSFVADGQPNSIYLGAGNLITVSEHSKIFGSSGLETVQIIGAPDVAIDQNIERVELGAELSNYSFRQQGNHVLISKAGAQVGNIIVQGDGDGTTVAFTDGAVQLTMTGSTIYCGSQALNQADYGTITAAQLGNSFNSGDLARVPAMTDAAQQTILLVGTIAADGMII